MEINQRIDITRILQKDEIRTVVEDLESRKNLNSAINHTIFRLSCCCGLRRCEIYGLNVGDVITSGSRPHIRVRPETSKASSNGKRKGRKVPLWWDSGTLSHLRHWTEHRFQCGANLTSPFLLVCKPGAEPDGRIAKKSLQKRWKTACKPLGLARQAQLSIHDGRHSFASHSLAAGRSLAEVRDALGHSNISITSIYLHTLDRSDVPDIFTF